jgi:hypothetical protein
MDWKNIAGKIAGAAPVLAGVLGGPAGAAASAAGSLVASVLGVKEDPAEVEAALKKDSDAFVKLKEIELKNRELIMGWKSQQLQADLENMKSAREREVLLAQAGSKNAYATPVIAFVVTVGFFWLLHTVLRESNIGQAGLLLLGTLSSGFGAVINYYLGSSLGSKEKDKLNLKQTK